MNKPTIEESNIFVCLLNKTSLSYLFDSKSKEGRQVKYAKRLRKLFILVFDNDLSTDDIIRAEEYFSAAKVLGEIRVNSEDSDSMEKIAKDIDRIIRESGIV